jgi:hypothetical protein
MMATSQSADIKHPHKVRTAAINAQKNQKVAANFSEAECEIVIPARIRVRNGTSSDGVK